MNVNPAPFGVDAHQIALELAATALASLEEVALLRTESLEPVR
jgi:hypothetical protein